MYAPSAGRDEVAYLLRNDIHVEVRDGSSPVTPMF